MKTKAPQVDGGPQSIPAPVGRRQFFAAGTRWLAVGGLAAFALTQELKRRRLASDPSCIRLNTCADCIEFSAGCRKDKAASFRAQRGA